MPPTRRWAIRVAERLNSRSASELALSALLWVLTRRFNKRAHDLHVLLRHRLLPQPDGFSTPTAWRAQTSRPSGAATRFLYRHRLEIEALQPVVHVRGAFDLAASRHRVRSRLDRPSRRCPGGGSPAPIPACPAPSNRCTALPRSPRSPATSRAQCPAIASDGNDPAARSDSCQAERPVSRTRRGSTVD